MTFDALLATSTLAQASPAAAPAAPADTAATGTTTAPAAPGAPGAAPAQQPFSMWVFILPIGAVMVMMWFTSRKEKKKAAEKAAEMAVRLQKGAKVTTISLARGKVTDVTDTEVTVKFDDCSITFLKAAIQSVDEVPA